MPEEEHSDYEDVDVILARVKSSAAPVSATVPAAPSGPSEPSGDEFDLVD
jgi:hypothetical protein